MRAPDLARGMARGIQCTAMSGLGSDPRMGNAQLASVSIICVFKNGQLAPISILWR